MKLHCFIQVRVLVNLKLILGTLAVRQGQVLNGTPVYFRAACMHTLKPRHNLA